MVLAIPMKFIIPLVVAICVVLIAALIIYLVIKNKNKGHVKVDNEFIDNIILDLGGKENIKDVNVDNARLKIGVNNLDLIKADELHLKSPSGVFITGNNIKLLFKYDSQAIKREIDKRMRG